MRRQSPTVQHYFQVRADAFDSLYKEDSWWRYQCNRFLRAGLYERVRFTLRELEGLTEFSVLDVGCGSGRNSVLFAQAGARRVLGVDFSARMIELAEQLRRAPSAPPGCDFVTADFLDYQFGERFDVVVALGFFDYFADPQPALRKMAQLSRSKVIASFPARSPLRAPFRKLRYALRGCPVYFYTAERLLEIAADVGLSDFKIVPYASSGLLLVARV